MSTFKKTSEETIFQKYWMSLKLENHILPNGNEFEFIVVDAPNWAIVVPEFGEYLIMIKQYRPAWNSLSIEFPGGRLHENEPVETGASRELREETGYKCDNIINVQTANPVSWTTQQMHICIATGLTHVGQELDDEEDIEVLKIKPNEIPALIKTEKIKQSSTILAYMMWLQNRG